jgi:hypothetical protein
LHVTPGVAGESDAAERDLYGSPEDTTGDVPKVKERTMASMKSKRAAALATLATSLMMGMGGAAFASPPSAVEGHGPNKAVVPDLINDAREPVWNATREAQRQVQEARNNPQSLGQNPFDPINDAREPVWNATREAQRHVQEARNNAQSLGQNPFDPINDAREPVWNATREAQRQVREARESLPSLDNYLP